MAVIKGIAGIILIIACVAIYHNTNSFETKGRIIYIVVGMILMYFVTSVLCYINLKGVEIKNEQALHDILSVVKMIFTPLNAMVMLSLIGNTLGKAKDQVIDTDKAGKRLLILAIVFIIILIFETNYIGHFIKGLLA